MAGALIGIAGAIGALGGVGINLVLRASYLSAAHSATMAFWVFLGCYVLCATITWFAYVRTAQCGSRHAVEEARCGAGMTRKSLVVVGHGMVGHRFVEAVRDRDPDGRWQITVLCEEPTPAYDRVALSSYVGSWDRAVLALPGNDYATDEFVELRTAVRATAIDREARVVTTSAGDALSYDALVLATGSYAFVPPIPGNDLDRCFVYRTLDDLDAIRAAAAPGAPAIVVGGGLLGLEAANALRLMGMTPHVRRVRPPADAGSGRRRRRCGAGRLGDRVGPARCTPACPQPRSRRTTTDCGLRCPTARRSTPGCWCSPPASGPATNWPAPAASTIAERGGVLTDIGCRTSDP